MVVFIQYRLEEKKKYPLNNYKLDVRLRGTKFVERYKVFGLYALCNLNGIHPMNIEFEIFFEAFKLISFKVVKGTQ